MPQFRRVDYFKIATALRAGRYLEFLVLPHEEKLLVIKAL